jgi:uncharacterized protein (TIGR02145 family)
LPGSTNSRGVTGLLAGSIFTNGTFLNRGGFGNWWSSSEISATNAHVRYLYNIQVGVTRASGNKVEGFSVRCLKD